MRSFASLSTILTRLTWILWCIQVIGWMGVTCTAGEVGRRRKRDGDPSASPRARPQPLSQDYITLPLPPSYNWGSVFQTGQDEGMIKGDSQRDTIATSTGSSITATPIPRDRQLPLPEVFVCIELQDRQCLNQLGRQIAYFPTIYTRNEMLAILMAAHQHNPKDPLIQAFHFSSSSSSSHDDGSRLNCLWVNFYFFHTYLSLHQFLEDSAAFEAIRETYSSADDPTPALEGLKRRGRIIMRQARHFNIISNQSMTAILEELGLQKVEVSAIPACQASIELVRRNLADLSDLEFQIRVTTQYAQVVKLLERYFTRGQAEVIRMNEGGREYMDRVSSFIASGLGNKALISPTPMDLIHLTLNKFNRFALWTDLVLTRRFDIIRLLVEGHGVFNLARSQAEGMPYLGTLISTLTSTSSAPSRSSSRSFLSPSSLLSSSSLSSSPPTPTTGRRNDYWPADHADVVRYVIKCSGGMALYPNVLDDVALTWQDTSTLRYLLQEEGGALPNEYLSGLVTLAERMRVKEGVVEELRGEQGDTALSLGFEAE